MFKEETVSFFNKFYSLNKTVKVKKNSHNLSFESFIKDNYYFKVKSFLPPRVLIKSKQTKVLDMGCGEGNYLLDLISKKKKGIYYGIDVSSEAINNAKNQIIPIIKQQLKQGNVTLNLSIQDASKTKFKNCYFDYVCIISVLHHVENYKNVIYEALRILKKGGSLIIVDLPYRRFHKVFGFFIKIIPKKTKELWFNEDLLIEDKFPERSRVSAREVKKVLSEESHVIEEEYHYLFFNYLIYFYKLFPSLFERLLPLNKFLINIEKRVKDIFKNYCDLYVFVCRKNG